MLDHEVRRRALLAVAKLSVVAGALGCGGGVIVSPGEEAAVTEEPEEDAVLPWVRPLPPPVDASCFTAEGGPEACCNTLLLASFADDHLWSDPSLATEEELACCDLAMATFATWQSAEHPPFDWTHSSNCCAIDVDTPLCTAWGPPMPPAMVRPSSEVLA